MITEAANAGDIVSEMAFGDIAAEAQLMVDSLSRSPATKADAVFLFEGAPVVGRQAIEVQFATAILQSIQSTLSSLGAAMSRKPVGQRGPLAANANHPLFITGVALGSFGFIIEEEPNDQDEAFATSERSAMDSFLDVIDAVSNKERAFDEAIDLLDHRSYSLLEKFFDRLSKSGARLKVEAVDRKLHLNDERVIVAHARLSDTELTEQEDEFLAKLIGLSPLKRTVELRREDTGEIVSAKAGAKLSQDYLERIERDGVTLGKLFRVEMLVKNVSRPDGSETCSFVILDLDEETGSTVDSI